MDLAEIINSVASKLHPAQIFTLALFAIILAGIIYTLKIIFTRITEIMDSRAKVSEERTKALMNINERFDETAARTDIVLKKARAELDEAYRAMIERVNALMIVEGIADYESFAKTLNAIIAKYAVRRHHHSSEPRYPRFYVAHRRGRVRLPIVCTPHRPRCPIAPEFAFVALHTVFQPKPMENQQ